MRRLFFAVVLAGLAYCAYWFIGVRTVNTTATQTVTDLRDAGWQIAYDSLRTRGFPSRFDTTVEGLVVTAPGNPVTWRVPFVQALALSYQPDRVIVVAPPALTAESSDVTVTFANTGLRMSAQMRGDTALGLDHATAEAQTLSLATPDLVLRTGPALAAIRLAETPLAYDIYAKVSGITLPEPLWQAAFPAGALPQSLDTVELNAVARFDVWPGAEDTPPLVTLAEVTLDDTSLRWGDLALTLSGALAPDAAGFAAGTITVEATNWQPLIDGLAAAGMIAPGIAATVQNMGQMMQAGGETLSLPLTFANGRVAMGFVPLGDAPRLIAP